jgi:hypothetical protein
MQALKQWSLLLLVVAPSLAIAQAKTLATPDEVRRAVEGVVASIAASNFPGALKELKPLSVLPPAEFDVFEAQVNSQAGPMLVRFGSPIGYELVREERAGQHLLRYTFVVLHEKAPVRWYFVAYRADKSWVITDFKFDGNSSAVFSGGG